METDCASCYVRTLARRFRPLGIHACSQSDSSSTIAAKLGGKAPDNGLTSNCDDVSGNHGPETSAMIAIQRREASTHTKVFLMTSA
jgi:hypothetical protein